MYATRTVETFVKRASKQFPVVLVTGARQVGKTTLLQHFSKSERTYVILDDPLVLSLAKEDPALFMQRFPPPVLIDEIQYAPELMPHIKMEADRKRIPGQFLLTASHRKDDIRHFQVIERLGMPIGTGGVICLTDRSHPISKTNQSIPISAL